MCRSFVRYKLPLICTPPTNCDIECEARSLMFSFRWRSHVALKDPEIHTSEDARDALLIDRALNSACLARAPLAIPAWPFGPAKGRNSLLLARRRGNFFRTSAGCWGNHTFM